MLQIGKYLLHDLAAHCRHHHRVVRRDQPGAAAAAGDARCRNQEAVKFPEKSCPRVVPEAEEL